MNMLPTNITLQLCAEVSEICKTLLSKTPIKVFEYSKIYPNGARVELSNHKAHMENAFIKKGNMNKVYTPVLIPQNQRYIFVNHWIKSLQHEARKPLSQQLISQHELFGIGNELSIIKRSKTYLEYFHFYAASNHIGIENFYLNNLEMFERFTLYFSSEGRHLIKLADKDPLLKPWRSNDIEISLANQNTKEFDNSFIKSITPKKFIVNVENRDVFFTKREIDCARQLIQGKTNKVIAEALFISLRTVETHLNSLRLKTNCNTRFQLIEFLLKSDFINI